MVMQSRHRDEDSISTEYKLVAEIMRNVLDIDKRVDIMTASELSDEKYERVLHPMINIDLLSNGLRGNRFPGHYQVFARLILDKYDEWNARRKQ